MVGLNLICIALYFSSGAQPKSDAYYGQGYGTIFLDDVRCIGNETDINECSHKPWTANDCDHSEDVGVYCTHAGMILLLFTVW